MMNLVPRGNGKKSDSLWNPNGRIPHDRTTPPRTMWYQSVLGPQDFILKNMKILRIRKIQGNLIGFTEFCMGGGGDKKVTGKKVQLHKPEGEDTLGIWKRIA